MPSFLDDWDRFELEEPHPDYGSPLRRRDLRPVEVIKAEQAAFRRETHEIMARLRERYAREDEERAAREDAEEEMKIGDAFPGQYLKSSDLGGRRALVVIDRCEIEDIGGERKPALYFKNKEKALILNRTNANSIQEIARTDETDRWRGVAIVLYPSKTDFQGKRVDCIRIDPPTKVATAPAQAAAAAPAPIEEPQPEAAFAATDDDVPF